MPRFLVILIFGFSSAAGADCVSRQIAVTAGQWRGGDARAIESRMHRHSGSHRRITVHYTGVKQNPRRTLVFKLRSLFEFSTKEKNGGKKALWGDVPYHYYLDMNGEVGEGRDPRFQPDTNTRYNPDGHVTIVVEGDEKDALSAAQKTKLFGLLAALQAKNRVPAAEIKIHRDFADTDCPGPAVAQAVKEYVQLHRNDAPEDCEP